MRVSVKYDERSAGLISNHTDIFLTFTIEFSDEEKAIIRQRDLAREQIKYMDFTFLVSPTIRMIPLMTYLPLIGVLFHRKAWYVTIAEILIHKVFIYRFQGGAAYAKEFDQTVRSSLRHFKEVVLANKDVGSDEVFEL